MTLNVRNIGWLLVLGAALVGIFMLEGWIDRGALAPEPVAEVDCGEAGVCSYRDAKTHVRLELGPERRVMRPVGIALQIEAEQAPREAIMRWRMDGMDMGDHTAVLKADSDGWWRGEVTLPVCASGHTGWIGRLEWGGQPLDFKVMLAP